MRFKPRSEYLPFSPPQIGEEEITAAVNVLRSDWITTGPIVREFQDEFARFVQSPDALALSSCTAALHVALLAAGVERGDAVITTPMTFCATANVIEHIGAVPILVDVDPETLMMSPQRIVDILKCSASMPPVKAILAVHLYGHPADLDALYDICRDFDLPLIEDAAHALPAYFRDRPIGSPAEHLRNLICFSFYATKNLTTIEGGMLCGPKDLLENARQWAFHGIDRPAWARYTAQLQWYYEVERPGFKYNMTDLQAAIGRKQLERLEEFQRRRDAVAESYGLGLGDLEHVQLPTQLPHVRSSRHLYAIRLNLSSLTINRDAFITEMANRNISSSVHFIPIHLHPYYRDKYGFVPDSFPVAFSEYQRLISLPLHPGLSDGDVQDVISSVRDVAENHRTR